MPTYEYHCDTCAKNFDVVQSFHDDALTACPTCGSPVKKVFGNVGIVFKGSGFYKTDSRNGGSAKKAAGDGAATPGSESSGSEASGSGDSGSSTDQPSTASSGDGSSGTSSGDKKPTPAPTKSPSKAAPTSPAT